VDFEVWLEFTDAVTGTVSSSGTPIGTGWSWAATCEFPMPNALPTVIQSLQAIFAGAAGKSRLFMKALVVPCNATIVDSNEAKIEPLMNQSTPANILGPLIACGRIVHVNNIIPGSILTLHSDALDAAQLGAPERIFTTEAFLPCYRPMRAGESVSVSMSGCGNSSINSGSVMVGAPPALLAPSVRAPIHPFDRGAWIDNIVPGARVHVFVNGLWRASVDSSAESVWADLGALNVEDSVTALQVLCEIISDRQPEGVRVTIGRLKVNHDPSPLVRAGAGSQTHFIIRARDADTGAPVNATAFINNVPFPVDQQLGTVIALGQDGPPTNIRAPGYADEPLVWNLIDPPVPGPAVLTVDLTSTAMGSSIDMVTWKLFSTSGPGNTSRVNISTKTGPTAQFQLPPPAGPNTEYLVECTADITIRNTGSFPNVVIAGTSNGWPNSAAIGWVGQNLAAHFGIQMDFVNDPMPHIFLSIKLMGTNP
jgi:hypothetical protein